ncbi:rhodanese-like domain-containing protein [Thiobacillus sp.]
MSVSRRSVAVFAAFALVSLGACSRDGGPPLSAPDAYAQAKAGTLTLIDVRTPDEWRKTGVAQGALRIDMAGPQGEAGFVQRVDAAMGGNRNAPIGLIGLAGNRAANARKVLRESGFSHVYTIKEGMLGSSAGPGWIARKLPVEACPNC